METKVIARIRNDYKTKFGIPRQSGLVNSVLSAIIFEPEYRDVNALRGIEEYSHLWILWEFSENDRKEWSPTVRPPRLGGNQRVGVFATRSPIRPNPIGLSCVKVEKIEVTEEGPVILVSGADMMNGTPVLDIKPYLPHIDIREGATGGFAGVVSEYRVEVEIPTEVEEQIPEEHREAIREMLSQDPRPGYQREESRIYGMEYAGLEIKFRGEGKKLILVSVEKSD